MTPTKHARTNYRLLLPLLSLVDGSGDRHHRFEAPGYMPLSLEYLHYNDYKGRPVYGMMHYTTHNGDLMRDPDMTFSVDRDAGTVHPMTYRNDFAMTDQAVYKTAPDDRLLYSRRLLIDLDDFLWRWLRNIHDQGYLG